MTDSLVGGGGERETVSAKWVARAHARARFVLGKEAVAPFWESDAVVSCVILASVSACAVCTAS